MARMPRLAPRPLSKAPRAEPAVRADLAQRGVPRLVADRATSQNADPNLVAGYMRSLDRNQYPGGIATPPGRRASGPGGADDHYDPFAAGEGPRPPGTHPGDSDGISPERRLVLEGTRANVTDAPALGMLDSSGRTPPTKYNTRALSNPNPPTVISDVDMAGNIWSPFQPLVPFGPPYVNYPRTFDYPSGYNIDFLPARLSFLSTLRTMSQSWGILRAVIETRKDQLMRIPWDFRLIGKPKEKNHPRLVELRRFFKKPDRKVRFDRWARLILEDLFVIDAANYYIWRRYDGRPYALMVTDGALVKPLIDDAGQRPDWPNPAFQQAIKGLPWVDLDEYEYVYAPMRPRPQAPMWGYSPVEQVYVEIMQGIRKMLYKLNFWCYSEEDTEVLTRRGWLRFSETDDHDEFATRHPQTHEFQWQRATGRFCEHYVGEMVKFEGRAVDLLVTPNHKMILSGLPRPLGGNGRRRGEVTVAAGDLVGVPFDNHGVPITSTWVGREIGPRVFGDVRVLEACRERDDKLVALRDVDGLTFRAIGDRLAVSEKLAHETYHRVKSGKIRVFSRPGGVQPLEMSGDQYCAFMGMWLAEGCVEQVGGRVNIAQRRSSKGFEKFERLLSEVFGSPYYNESGGNFEVTHSRLARFLRQFGHAEDKYVPDDIMNATPRQIAIFLEYLWLGDGASDMSMVYTSSRCMADQLVELAQKIGTSASLGVDRASVRVANGQSANFDNYRVYFRQAYPYTKGFSASRVQNYSGRVACVRVPNGTLFVRRNNKAVWCGNTEGSVPDLIVTVPKEWTAQQIAAFQAHMDAMLSGNATLKSKIRFLPSEMRPFDIKNASGEILKSAEDEWVTRLICYVFSVPPTPFITQINRATAETAAETAEEEGLHPLMTWFKEEIVDPVVQDDQLGFGYDDCEFVWLPEPEVDAQKQMTVLTGYTKEALMTYDEAREQINLPPYPDGIGSQPIMATPQGPVPLAETLEANRQRALDVPGQITRTQESHEQHMQGGLAGKAASTFQEGEDTWAALARVAARRDPEGEGGRPHPHRGARGTPRTDRHAY